MRCGRCGQFLKKQNWNLGIVSGFDVDSWKRKVHRFGEFVQSKQVWCEKCCKRFMASSWLRLWIERRLR